MARRDEILKAIYEADRLHAQYDSKARVERGEGRVDVFSMLLDRDILVMFRPLKNLLGAYFSVPGTGVMVTTTSWRAASPRAATLQPSSAASRSAAADRASAQSPAA